MSDLVGSRSAFQALRSIAIAAALTACNLFCGTVAVAQDVSPSIKLPPMEAPLKTSYYPADAIKRHMQGRVLVEFTVTRKGRVDNVKVLQAEPDTLFDNSVRIALKDVKFTVPADWESSGAAQHRFQLSYVFKIYPCPSDPCTAPVAHESADDSIVISIQVGK